MSQLGHRSDPNWEVPVGTEPNWDGAQLGRLSQLGRSQLGLVPTGTCACVGGWVLLLNALELPPNHLLLVCVIGQGISQSMWSVRKWLHNSLPKLALANFTQPCKIMGKEKATIKSFKDFDLPVKHKNSYVKQKISEFNQKTDLLYVRNFCPEETYTYFPVECSKENARQLARFPYEKLHCDALDALSKSRKTGFGEFMCGRGENSFRCVVRCSKNFLDTYCGEKQSAKVMRTPPSNLSPESRITRSVDRSNRICLGLEKKKKKLSPTKSVVPWKVTC